MTQEHRWKPSVLSISSLRSPESAAVTGIFLVARPMRPVTGHAQGGRLLHQGQRFPCIRSATSSARSPPRRITTGESSHPVSSSCLNTGPASASPPALALLYFGTVPILGRVTTGAAMRACKQCGLSIGDTATFCPVCGIDADPGEASPTAKPPAALVASDQAVEVFPEEAGSRSAEAWRGVLVASDHESEARRCEKTDAPRATALYRQAILEYLESSEDSLDSQFVRRDVQRIFDRLSLVLKRSGLIEEALEEVDSAAYLGLVDGEDCGTKARREALIKRRDTLRCAVTKAAQDKG